MKHHPGPGPGPDPVPVPVPDLLLGLLLLLLLLLAACDPRLYAASIPPPGTIGRLDSEDRFAELTQGAAIAFHCDDAGPCRRARATSDNPEIAAVLPAALARLERDVTRDSMTPAATFVIVAKQPGTTRIRVTSSDGDTSLRVTVLPPP